MRFVTNIQVFTADGVWLKPANLAYVVLVMRSAGGGGSVYGYGGGGGSAVQTDPIYASTLPALVEVLVGQGGVGNRPVPGGTPADGGPSQFADYHLGGGSAAGDSYGGIGALAPMRGGSGTPPGVDGQAVHALPVTLLSGGGGGGGSNGWGGWAGMTPPYATSVMWPYTHQSGPGGSHNKPGVSHHGMFPAGGGAAGGAPLGEGGDGAAGCVTVIETLFEETP